MDELDIPDIGAWLKRQNTLVRALVEPFVGMLGEIIDALRAMVSALRAQIAEKDHRIAQLERQLFGRKSERLKIPDARREARRAMRQRRTPEEREAERQAERERSRKERASLPVVDKVTPNTASAAGVRRAARSIALTATSFRHG